MSGKGLTGEDGLLKPLIARFVEAALEAELTEHLRSEKERRYFAKSEVSRNRRRLVDATGERRSPIQRNFSSILVSCRCKNES